MTLIKSIYFITLLFGVYCFNNFAQSSASINSNTTLKGSVFDLSEAVIPGVEIIVMGNKIKKSATSNNNGEYQFELPDGIYRLYIKQRKHYEIVYPLNRASFQVHSDNLTTINIYPKLIHKAIALTIISNEIHDEVKIFNRQSQFEQLPFSTSSTLNVSVEFERKFIHKKGVTEYRNVTLTYDNITVVAYKILVDKSRQQIVATGFNSNKLLIDENGQKKKVCEAILTFGKITTITKNLSKNNCH